MKKTSFVLVLLASMFLLAGSGYGQRPRFNFRVFISAKDQETKSQFESFVSREIRSLGDAEVSDKGEYWLEIAVLAVVSQRGQTLGYAYNFTLTKQGACGGSLTWDLLDHTLYVGDSESLRHYAEEIVTDIDNGVLKKLRAESKK